MENIMSIRQSRRVELVEHDIADLEWLINFIDSDLESEPEQLAIFSEIVDKAAQYGVDPDDLCDKFGVNRSTVSRWRNKKSAPQQYVRPLILKEISNLLENLVDEKKNAMQRIAV